MAAECWASVLEDCANGASREHYISDGIFDGHSVTAVGLPWCRDEPVTIGIRSAVAKILCRRHNSALSPFDAEAARLSQFLATNVLDEPLAESTIRVSGSAIEKWALKTFFNLGYLRGLHREQPNRLDPPVHLLQYLYRNALVPEGVGLYFVTSQISNDNFGPGLWWNVIQHPERPHEIFGMAFTFFGLRFVISIPPFRAEAHIAGLGNVNEFDYSTARIIYRPLRISMMSGNAGSKHIHFEW
jgi:hypothetical protein